MKPFNISIIFFVILFVSLSLLSFISSGHDLLLFYAKLIWSLVVSYFGLCIYRSGAISRYRSYLFILIALSFFLEFKFPRFSSSSNTPSPYCHIAQAATVFNFVHSQFLAITSGQWRIWGVLTLGFLWLLIMFTIGQGICSWVCFYGGIDEACSKLAKKPLIKLRVSKVWRDFPLAFLVFLLIVSFLQGLPVFCTWFCPFKLTEAFWDSNALIRSAQAAFFWLLLGGFVVLLPILSKKRTFCSLICPFGALSSVCGRLSPYRVTINEERCTHCGKCQDACPVFAIGAKAGGKLEISPYCNRCGRCIDTCPQNAVDISIVGNITTLCSFKHPKWEIKARDIFIFLSLLITGVVSGLFVPRMILQLVGLG